MLFCPSSDDGHGHTVAAVGAGDEHWRDGCTAGDVAVDCDECSQEGADDAVGVVAPCSLHWRPSCSGKRTPALLWCLETRNTLENRFKEIVSISIQAVVSHAYSILHLQYLDNRLECIFLRRCLHHSL